MKKKEAEAIAGSLTCTSKMPCPSYSLPAQACKIGRMLAQVEGSICSQCYAMKGRYLWAGSEARAFRLASISHSDWTDAMVSLIGSNTHFRWHDSGDLQSIEHFAKIVEVCRRTPHCKHWLPTRERFVVEGWIEAGGVLPKNLTVRMSASLFDARITPIKGMKTTSGSHKNAAPIGFECPAPKQGNTCGDCRVCWDKRVRHVSYAAH